MQAAGGSPPGGPDVFAVPAEMKESLQEQQPNVERIFRVQLSIPSAPYPGSPHIWLQLQGSKENVGRAKEFVKGLCSPELLEEIDYAPALDCVFRGARGLFLDCLCWATSVHLVPRGPGTLMLWGLAEAFALAQSRVEEMERRLEAGGTPAGEARVTGAFQALLESCGGDHIPELLALPAAVQQELLSLVQEAGRGQWGPGTPESWGALPGAAGWPGSDREEEAERAGNPGPWDRGREGRQEEEEEGEEEGREGGPREDDRLGARPRPRSRAEVDQRAQDGPESGFLLGVIQAAAESCGHPAGAVPSDLQGEDPFTSLLLRLNGERPDPRPGPPGSGSRSPVARKRPPGSRGRGSPRRRAAGGGGGGGGGVVTGSQRFQEALRAPFSLNLANVPGLPGLRHLIIDGSNVAMVHGLHHVFSCRGVALAVQYFWDRGHREITVFVPQWRLKRDPRVKEGHFLTILQDLRLLSVTPSHVVDGKRITPYDDRFMLRLAEETDGVIVTNDQLRDLAEESGKWVAIIRERLLPFTFVGNIFMVPDDPLGRNGPTLDEFLSKPTRSPSSPGCRPAGQRPPSPQAARPAPAAPGGQARCPAQEPEQKEDEEDEKGEQDTGQEAEGGAPSSQRGPEETERLRHRLLEIFSGQDQKVDFVLEREPCTRDLNQLSEAFLGLRF
ncbi:protein KHNYN-like [Tachyglossus aculeatus]|uniref:protein KHNYN-like n=1 Tax=Tachyglossus aculeatus TaxID=9261 RepID=UPI0018F2D3A6|nr:protein KHNYN-like [Tachyglossus aculeatus]